MAINPSEVFLPSNIKAIVNLKRISLLSGTATIFLSILLALNNTIDISIAAACVTGSLLVCFHLLRKPGKSLTIIQMIFGISISFLVALFSFFHFLNFSFKDLYAITIFCIVVSIFLLSVKVHHRHHFSHLFAFAAVMLSAYQFFQAVYSIFIGKVALNTSYDSLLIAILLLLFSQTILLCKPDRGFLGMMTTNTTSSKVSLHFLLYFIIIGPIATSLVLIGEIKGLYPNETVIPLLVTILTVTSITMNWLNAKFLYKLELEKYLITEVLRVNNIHLETKSEDLKTQIAFLEREKEEMRDKYDTRNKLRDIISSQG